MRRTSAVNGYICPGCVSNRMRRVLAPTEPQLRQFTTRPSIAPRPALDVKHIVQNSQLYEQNCADRNFYKQRDSIKEIVKLAKRRNELNNSFREQRGENNQRERRIKQLQLERREEGEISVEQENELKNLFRDAATFKKDDTKHREQEKEVEGELEHLVLALPNLSSTQTPVGDEPKFTKLHKGPNWDRNHGQSKSHVDIGAELDVLDFEASSKASGWGWYFLKNEAALLEQALVQYVLSLLRRRRWTIVSPPTMVYSYIAAACGFQPRDQNGEQQIYNIQQPEGHEGKPPLSLVGTSEISLAAMKSSSTFKVEDLPLKVAAVSRCYRAEAGARGVDTKGLYRVHEFTKVEMFSWTLPDSMSNDHFASSNTSMADATFNDMIDIQEQILKELELDFRVGEMPTEDLGAAAFRKVDMEVFLPSRKMKKSDGYGEVSSASICTDYQSRRLDTRLLGKDGRLYHPWTMNGTALAVPRIVAALLETRWDDTNKTLDFPKVLMPWLSMFGVPHQISVLGRLQQTAK